MNTAPAMPIENITHRTASRPFSLHHTITKGPETCALYLHCHPEAEFFYLEQGELCFHIESHTYTLRSGDGIFIPPNLIHHAEQEANAFCSYYAVVFSADSLEQYLPPYCHTYFSALASHRMDCIYPILASESQNALLLSHLSALFTYRSQPLESYELALTGALLICWQELYNHCFVLLTTPAADNPHANELQKSIDYLHLHFGENISLGTLAKEAGLSEGYFCHRFKSFTGVAPFSYLNRIRIVKSCELLSKTNKKITEIALLCGYSNISYFNRTFYKTMGITPSAYRSSFR